LFDPEATDANDGDSKAEAAREEEEEEDEDFRDGDEEHAPVLPLGRPELEKLYRFPLISRRVTQQTGKGKIHRRGVLVVVGNGDGLVGYGEAKHDDSSRATNRAFAMAVRNMDYVDRFEGRTIWTEVASKLGATRIILRPRPVGFGLHCNPNIHQVLKAAGIKDISAKVWGSRNPLNVIKLLFRMLHAGNAPLAMGNGIGGPGRKLDKGSGVRGKQEIERERGRKLLNLRTR
jgi:small subunit ribosomal protein S5